MEAFHQHCTDIGCAEYRSLLVQDHESLPRGQYGLMEFYCAEPDCDCRRVIISVCAPHISEQPVATFSYGWESPDFYDRWSSGAEMGERMAGPSIEPFAPQSDYAKTLFDMFQDFVLDDIYIERLKRHYDLFKQAILAGHAKTHGRSARTKARARVRSSKKRSKKKKRRKGKRNRRK